MLLSCFTPMLFHVGACVCVFVCLCSFQHHLHPSHLSAADFPLNMIEMPLATNTTFTLYCTSGEVLQDRFPVLRYVKNGRKKNLRCFWKQEKYDFKDWGKKTHKINIKGKKQPQQSVMICVPSRTSFWEKGREESVYLRLSARVWVSPSVAVRVCVWGRVWRG